MSFFFRCQPIIMASVIVACPVIELGRQAVSPAFISAISESHREADQDKPYCFAGPEELKKARKRQMRGRVLRSKRCLQYLHPPSAGRCWQQARWSEDHVRRTLRSAVHCSVCAAKHNWLPTLWHGRHLLGGCYIFYRRHLQFVAKNRDEGSSFAGTLGRTARRLLPGAPITSVNADAAIPQVDLVNEDQSSNLLNADPSPTDSPSHSEGDQDLPNDSIATHSKLAKPSNLFATNDNQWKSFGQNCRAKKK